VKKNKMSGTSRTKQFFATKTAEISTIAEASEMRLLKQQMNTIRAAPRRKKLMATTIFKVAFWKRVVEPTVPPTG